MVAQPSGWGEAAAGPARRVSSPSGADRRRISAGYRRRFAYALAFTGLITLAVVLGLVALQRSANARAVEQRTVTIATSASRLLVDLLDAETGQRGFVITGRGDYLRPYRTGAAAVPGELSRLAAVSAPAHALAPHVSLLRSLSTVKLAELAATIKLIRAGHRARAIALIDFGEGKHTMDLARAQIAVVLRIAQALPDHARGVAEGLTEFALLADGLLMSLALIVALRWRVLGARAADQRDRAVRDLLDSERFEARLRGALHDVASASASGELDGDALGQLVASRVRDLLDAASASVVRFDGELLTVLASSGHAQIPEQFPAEAVSACGQVARTGRAALVDDYNAVGGDIGRLATADGITGSVAVPVRLYGRLWGCLGAATDKPSGFRADAEALLERFATITSSALASTDKLATLRRRATTDGLTGLLNRRAFLERLTQEHSRAARHGGGLAVIMFDLDGFKAVNDSHGHHAGDQVLEAVARAFMQNKRACDVPARIGGDEFALLAPETTSDDAVALAERLRGAAAAEMVELGVAITLSAGVTDLRAAVTPHDLLHLADSALYWAKHHGRDQAVRYSAGQEDPFAEQRERILRRGRAIAGLRALARAVDAKERATQGHAERVAEIAEELARRLGWSLEQSARLREAALLHDVGKIGIPDAILTKAGKLTPHEYEQVKTYTVLGARITEGTLDEDQVRWVRWHHERPDGGGYPDALRGEEIPDGALMLGLGDAFDAMTKGRSYQTARSASHALRELCALAGTQFDRRLVGLLEAWTLEEAKPEGRHTHAEAEHAERPLLVGRTATD